MLHVIHPAADNSCRVNVFVRLCRAHIIYRSGRGERERDTIKADNNLFKATPPPSGFISSSPQSSLETEMSQCDCYWKLRLSRFSSLSHQRLNRKVSSDTCLFIVAANWRTLATNSWLVSDGLYSYCPSTCLSSPASYPLGVTAVCFVCF